MTISGQLDQLVSAGLIAQNQAQTEQSYLFRHSLLHDAAYSSLLRQDRRKLHLSVARLVERQYAAHQEEYAPVLAQHYLEGGDDDRALHFFKMSADHAASIYANIEASMHYVQAIQIARSTQDYTELLTDLYQRYGRVLEVRSMYDEALTTYTELQRLGQERADRRMELSALVLQATVQSVPTVRFNPEVGLALSQQALVLAHALGDHATESRILWNLMHIYYFTGRAEEAITYGEQSLLLAREYNLREQIAYTLNDLYTSLATTGQLDRAEQALVESRALWRDLGNLPMLADNLNSSAELMYQRGRLNTALEYLEESSSISQRIKNTWGLAYSSMIKGYVFLDQAKFDLSIATLDEAAILGDEAGFVIGQIYTRLILAYLYGILGLLDRALVLHKKAVEIAKTRAPTMGNVGSSILALLYWWQGDQTNMQTALENARALVKNNSEIIPFDSLVLSLVEAEISSWQGAYDKTLYYAELFLADSTRNGFYAYYHNGILLRARALIGLGKLEDAQHALQDGIVSARARDCRRIIYHFEYLLSEVESALGNTRTATQLRKEAADAAREILNSIQAPYLREAFATTRVMHDLLSDDTPKDCNVTG